MTRFHFFLQHYAARAGHLEVCRELLRAGTVVDVRTSEGGQTALHRAALCGHRAVVQELLRAGADVGAIDVDGETALHKVTHNTLLVAFLC